MSAEPKAASNQQWRYDRHGRDRWWNGWTQSASGLWEHPDWRWSGWHEHGWRQEWADTEFIGPLLFPDGPAHNPQGDVAGWQDALQLMARQCLG